MSISKELAERIIAELPSASLRKAIKEQKRQFSDRDLFLIAAKYCRLLETRWKLLSEIVGQADREISEWAKNYLAHEKRVKEKFCEADERCVYVTYFLYEHSWDSDRIFKAFDNALKYCRAELADDNEYQCAKIEKHFLGEYTDKWSTFQGDCELDKRGEILRFGFVGEEEKTSCIYSAEGLRDCENCKEPCVDETYPEFPKFLNDYDIINYVDYCGKTIHGIVLYGLIADDNTVYVTSMEGDPIDLYMEGKPFCKPEEIREFQNEVDYLRFAQHEHIELSEIERVEYRDLPEKYQRIYDKLSLDLKKIYD